VVRAALTFLAFPAVLHKVSRACTSAVVCKDTVLIACGLINGAPSNIVRKRNAVVPDARLPTGTDAATSRRRIRRQTCVW
jgi:hypothetical protein